MNKFQRSRLAFELLAEVAHIGVPHSFFRNTRPIELKFHMDTPQVWGRKVCWNVSGHTTKMAVLPT